MPAIIHGCRTTFHAYPDIYGSNREFGIKPDYLHNVHEGWFGWWWNARQIRGCHENAPIQSFEKSPHLMGLADHRGPGCRKLVHKPKLFWPSLNFVWILWAPGHISTCEKGQKCWFYWIFLKQNWQKKSTENCSKSQNFHLQSWKYTDMTRFLQIEAQDDHIHI